MMRPRMRNMGIQSDRVPTTGKFSDRIRRWLAFCGIIPILVSNVACAQDPESLLKEAAERYRTLDAYYIEGDVTVETIAGGSEQEFEMSVMMAERPPSFVRAEVHGPTMQIVAVMNEEGHWLYMPELNQYAYSREAPPAEMGGISQDLLGEYMEMDEGVESVRSVGRESVEVGGEMREAFVLDVEYEAQQTPAGADTTRKRLWIDAQEKLVLRDETSSFVSQTPFGEPMTIRETTTFTVLNVVDPPDLSVFEFTPPEGASEVAPNALQGSSAGPQPGMPAPNFSLPRLDEGVASLREYRGGIVLINFWATWCGPCLMEMPELERLHRAYENKGLHILGVNLGEPAGVVRDYVTRLGLTFPILLDESYQVGDEYQANSLPTSVIVDREGNVASILLGAHPEEAFLQALREAGL